MSRIFASTVVLLVAGAAATSSLDAQVVDSASAGAHPHGSHHDPRFLLGMASIVFAPGLLDFVLPIESPPGEQAAPLERVWLRGEAGISSPGDSYRVGTAFAVAFHALSGGIYVDAELSRLGALDSRWFYSARAGHLWRSFPGSAGGVVVGVRSSEAPARTRVEVGFPLISQLEQGAMILEANYQFGPGCACWNWRAEFEFGTHPRLRPGFAMTLRDIPREEGGQGFTLYLSWLLRNNHE